QWSQAMPETLPSRMRPCCCSNADQSLTLPPSTWWAALAQPIRNPSGRRKPLVGTLWLRELRHQRVPPLGARSQLGLAEADERSGRELLARGQVGRRRVDEEQTGDHFAASA